MPPKVATFGRANVNRYAIITANKISHKKEEKTIFVP
jgi:hypothetical protein